MIVLKIAMMRKYTILLETKLNDRHYAEVQGNFANRSK